MTYLEVKLQDEIHRLKAKLEHAEWTISNDVWKKRAQEAEERYCPFLRAIGKVYAFFYMGWLLAFGWFMHYVRKFGLIIPAGLDHTFYRWKWVKFLHQRFR